LLILPVLLFIATGGEDHAWDSLESYQVRLHLHVVWWVGTIPKISSCELEPDEKLDFEVKDLCVSYYERWHSLGLV
jgi:hypothetical protein